jgi:hypothetical protein
MTESICSVGGERADPLPQSITQHLQRDNSPVRAAHKESPDGPTARDMSC